MWGPHGVDRFANVDNRKTKRFNSLYWNPGTLGATLLIQTGRALNIVKAKTCHSGTRLPFKVMLAAF
jgi:hypothetical protein